MRRFRRLIRANTDEAAAYYALGVAAGVLVSDYEIAGDLLFERVVIVAIVGLGTWVLTIVVRAVLDLVFTKRGA